MSKCILILNSYFSKSTKKNDLIASKHHEKILRNLQKSPKTNFNALIILTQNRNEIHSELNCQWNNVNI